MPPFPVFEVFASMLQRCLPERRNQVLLQSHILRSGLVAHWMLGNQVGFRLAESGCSAHAFEHLLNTSSVSWNNLIIGYVRHRKPALAIKLYVQMQEHDCTHHLNGHSLLALLKACIDQKDLDMGSQIHQHHIVENGPLQTDAFLQSTVVDMYAKCGSMDKAYNTFSTLSARDVVSWTALINGYVENDQEEEALACIEKMQQEGVYPDAFTFSGSLKACSIAGAVAKGQQLHANLTMIRLEDNVVIASTLIDMYAKNNFVGEALKVFETLNNRNIITWNALLSGLTEHGHCEKTLECFQQLQNEGSVPDSVTLTCVLQACGKMGSLNSGKEVHILITNKGEDTDPSVGNTLVDMYAKCSSLAEAQAVFACLPNQFVVSWNVLIGGYVEHQHGKEALECYKQMQFFSISPNHITFLHVLKACGDMDAESEVQDIHIAVFKKGLEKSLFIANSLIDVYAKYGMLLEARNFFDRLAMKDKVSWTVLCLGYIEHAHIEEALLLIAQMQNDNVPFEATTYSCSLKVCASLEDANKGRQLHAEILRKGLDRDLFLANSLLDMYVKCALCAEACETIDKLLVRTTTSWNTLIKGCMDCELYQEALYSLELMQNEAMTPDYTTYTSCLHACSTIGLVDKGQQLHSTIIKEGLDENIIVGCTLIEAYSKWGLLVEAHQIFTKIPVKSIFSWTALLTGLIDYGCGKEVFEYWKQMQCEGVSPDVVMYTCGLRASTKLGALDKGIDFHMDIVKRGLEEDCNVGCTLVLMYCKCDALVEGQEVFDKLVIHTEVTWTVLIASYLEHGSVHMVLDCLDRMQNLGYSVGNVTLASGLKACGNTGNIYKGQELCNQIFERGMEPDPVINIAMVDMYAKCGLLLEARRTFDKLSGDGSGLWTVLITGYADAGESQKAFNAFDMMSREGHCLDLVTFLSVLKACVHAGLLDQGEKYLECMIRHFKILPNLEHCGCIIDLFTRAGCLEKAFKMVNTIPFQPSIVVWQTLLGACRRLTNEELGMCLFEQALELDERETAVYICMANIYAESYYQCRQ